MKLRRQREKELEEEIQSHLRMAIRDRIERGESAEEPEIAARREFGNVGLIKETTRGMWGWTEARLLFDDMRYGLRMLRLGASILRSRCATIDQGGASCLLAPHLPISAIQFIFNTISVMSSP